MIKLEVRVKDSGDLPNYIRFMSVQTSHSGDWLNVIPNPNLGLALKSRDFIVVVKYRLGLDLNLPGLQCPKCYEDMDTKGVHTIKCSITGDCIYQHNSICDYVFELATSAGLRPAKEVGSLF